MFKGWKGTLLYLLVIAAALAVLLSFWWAGRAAASDGESVRLPILMYHDITDNPLEAGDYALTTEQLEEDLRALKDNGWTPVSVSAVLRYVLEGEPLPDRPVLLVFDDGYRSFLTRALPLLRAHDAPAAVSVIGRQAQQARAGDGGAFMSWDELQEAAQSGLVEFVSHSAGLHVYCQRSGAARLECESEAAYTQVLQGDLQRMTALCEAAGVAFEPVFAYPYGSLEPLAEPLLQAHGFLATLTSEEHVNVLTRSADCLYLLGRLNRSAFLQTQDVLDWMESGR